MKNKQKNESVHFLKRDIVVIICSCIAFVCLLVLAVYSVQRQRKNQQELSQINGQLQDNVGTESDIDTPIINEVNQSGWVELYNTGKQQISLTGLKLLVNGKEENTIAGDEVLKPGEFFVIDQADAVGNSGHDIVTLCDAANQEIASVLVPKLDANTSYGRIQDGDISMMTVRASKGRSNAGTNDLTVKNLVFSVPGGFYPTKFQLELIAPEGASIYYTTDGTTPTKDAVQYTQPIEIEGRSGSDYQYANADGIGYASAYRPSAIDRGTIVKAIMIDAAGNQSEVVTESYFVGLANKNEYQNVPIISITSEPSDLFDYFTGMYVSGHTYEDAIAAGRSGVDEANYLNGWKKAAHVEYFEDNKAKTFEGEANLSLLKDFSITSVQKSFCISDVLSANLMGTSLTTYFRNNGADFTLQTGRRDNNYQTREYLVNQLLTGSSVGTQDIRPCILFLDGEFWGVYMLRSDYDASYIKRHYDVSDDVVFVKNGTSSNWDYRNLYNNFYQFVTQSDLSSAENYQMVLGQMDMQSYLDYFCANMYLSNADYGEDDSAIWRTIQTGSGYSDGKWRWLIGKTDNTVDNATASKLTTSSLNSYLQKSVTSDAFFQSLLKNEQFRQQLYTTMKRMAEQTFSAEQVKANIDIVSKQMQKLAVCNYKRFVLYPNDTFYSDEIKKIEDFFTKRGDYIMRYTKEVAKIN